MDKSTRLRHADATLAKSRHLACDLPLYSNQPLLWWLREAEIPRPTCHLCQSDNLKYAYCPSSMSSLWTRPCSMLSGIVRLIRNASDSHDIVHSATYSHYNRLSSFPTLNQTPVPKMLPQTSKCLYSPTAIPPKNLSLKVSTCKSCVKVSKKGSWHGSLGLKSRFLHSQLKRGKA
jgi:hypothetical protein